MASPAAISCQRLLWIIVGLFTELLLHHPHLSEASSSTPPFFCPLTLSRPTCPDLPTYDAFDISTYGGRWFEIGSTANFKNVAETGGICVLANYSLLQAPSPGKGGVAGVVNTIYSLGVPLHNVSQVVISLTAGQICADAFSICAQIDESSSHSSSSLFKGLALVSNVTLAIQDKNPSAAESLAAIKGRIDNSTADINAYLDDLSALVSKIQVLTAALGQGEGNASAKAKELFGVVADSNSTLTKIADALKKIEKQRQKLQGVAGTLILDGDVGNSVALGSAAGTILAGEGAIAQTLVDIEAALATVSGTVSLFLTPRSGAEGYTGRIVGTATQNASFAGKLDVQFPGTPPGGYWVLAVEPDTSSNAHGEGYAATLVYGCDQNDGGNGIEETLFVLSRTPTLPEATVRRLLDKAAALGVTGACSTPFIFTVQSRSCGNPPSDIAPSY